MFDAQKFRILKSDKPKRRYSNKNKNASSQLNDRNYNAILIKAKRASRSNKSKIYLRDRHTCTYPSEGRAGKSNCCWAKGPPALWQHCGVTIPIFSHSPECEGNTLRTLLRTFCREITRRRISPRRTSLSISRPGVSRLCLRCEIEIAYVICCTCVFVVCCLMDMRFLLLSDCRVFCMRFALVACNSPIGSCVCGFCLFGFANVKYNFIFYYMILNFC